MVKMIRGVYGYLDANGNVNPKTPKDEPFALTKEQEKRLVDRGCAVYVDVVKDTQEEKHDNESNLQDTHDVETTYYKKMTYNELKVMASHLGVPAVGKREELIQAIMKAKDELSQKVLDTQDDEDDAPPVLEAQDPE